MSVTTTILIAFVTAFFTFATFVLGQGLLRRWTKKDKADSDSGMVGVAQIQADSATETHLFERLKTLETVQAEMIEASFKREERINDLEMSFRDAQGQAERCEKSLQIEREHHQGTIAELTRLRLTSNEMQIEIARLTVEVKGIRRRETE